MSYPCPFCGEPLSARRGSRGQPYLNGLPGGRVYFCSPQCKEAYVTGSEEPLLGELIDEGISFINAGEAPDGLSQIGPRDVTAR